MVTAWGDEAGGGGGAEAFDEKHEFEDAEKSLGRRKKMPPVARDAPRTPGDDDDDSDPLLIAGKEEEANIEDIEVGSFLRPVFPFLKKEFVHLSFTTRLFCLQHCSQIDRNST